MSPAVIALDKLMRRLTDDERAEMRRTAPLHLVDQFDAAATQAERLLKDMGRDLGATLGGLDYAAVPDWLRLSLVDTWLAFIAGTADTCMHAPVVSRPEPVVAAVWRPALIVCTACTHLTKVTGEADRTCDRCARVCTGLAGDRIHPCSLTFGPLLYMFGLCPGCMADHKVRAE